MVDAQVAVARDGDRTIIEVAQGKVEVVPASGGPGVVVPAENYLILSPARKPQIEPGWLALRLEPALKRLPRPEVQ